VTIVCLRQSVILCLCLVVFLYLFLNFAAKILTS